jgi:hypothetical protein
MVVAGNMNWKRFRIIMMKKAGITKISRPSKPFWTNSDHLFFALVFSEKKNRPG